MGLTDGSNNWNNNEQVRMQVENASLENQMWESNPQAARQNAKLRLWLHLLVLAVAVAGLSFLMRGL